ncbi:hypothetical protein J4526_03710 [Desulfurococcaceae archaeon MEX13E-LK6-19]|nr:hypothetical protein J4526_03710 [Desulfurococcaceae archaeon MEX13E-LK6-19]
MSVNITVRIPRRLAEKMRRYREINWSEVVRKSIEEYLRRLEETRLVESSNELLEDLKELGVDEESLKPLPYNVEKKLYEEMVKKEWRRIDSTTQAR